MARQNTAPVQFQRSVRDDNGILMTSGRAGIVMPLAYVPLLRGDSAAGRISVDMNLAEMPKPLLNAVFVNLQAWFVPKSAHPQFYGIDDFLYSYQGMVQRGASSGSLPDRQPVSFFRGDGNMGNGLSQKTWVKRLGLHYKLGFAHADLYDALALVYNFRLQAHSTKLPVAKFYGQPANTFDADFRAFWPTGRFSRIVPDYERALLLGNLDLDVLAGNVNLKGFAFNPIKGSAYIDKDTLLQTDAFPLGQSDPGIGGIFADLTDQTITSTLADLDKARTTQAFAKLRASYAGNDPQGLGNDLALLATLMQGLSVPSDLFKRPWLLDSKRVPFGFAERFASDGESLDQSVTTGRVSGTLSVNVPTNDTGGLIVVTAEVLPERVDERMDDEWLYYGPTTEKLPDALRDVQRPEPVDLVPNSRLDVKHTSPDALYGYEPMNDKWNRVYTRLGGRYFQPDPNAPTNDARMGIWLANIVNPVLNSDHWLAPSPFPHNVFADTTKDAVDITVRHAIKIAGLTQIGDPLVEDNSDWTAVAPDAPAPGGLSAGGQ
ncbi:MAG: major capsid protein [Microviridae sp.]|nr:MAG: major capsid protein [Microviridae sp.]